LRGSIGFRCAR